MDDFSTQVEKKRDERSYEVRWHVKKYGIIERLEESKSGGVKMWGRKMHE